MYEVLAKIYTVLKKLHVDDLLEKRKLLINYPFPYTLYKDFNRKLKQRSLSNACLLYYGPFPLFGSGFDKCFLPVIMGGPGLQYFLKR